MLVDLRSDTVTRPTPEMRRAMADAEVGDDEYGEDPTVNLLQERFAEMVGKEAALFVPSGTMANQIALRTLTTAGQSVVVGAHQHVVLYEAGAGPRNAGVTMIGIDDGGGTLPEAQVELVIAGATHHQPPVGLVCLEDSHMASGGRIWSLDAARRVAAVARAASVPVHLDGARLWNASVASATAPAERAAYATTVMCCLSKGLGAPVGSLLAGPGDVMTAAVVERKRLGGAMRQAGVIAAAGLVALTRIERLGEDHARARRLAEAVAERWPGIGFDPAHVETNIVVFSPPDPAGLLAHLRDAGVAAGTIGPGRVRLVTHADVDDAAVDHACLVISKAA